MEIKAFLDYLRFERNFSEKTVKEYGDDLKSLEAFFKEMDATLSWESIDSDIIRDWMEWMMDKGNAATSINRRLSAVRSFYRFALSRNIANSDPAHCVCGPKKEKPLPHFLRENEINTLLDIDLRDPDNYVDLRTRTIIMMFYESGLRVSELVGLDDTSVDFTSRQIKVTGKRNKQRIVPFGQELYDAISHYIHVRDNTIPKMSTALFLSSKGQRITHNQVRRDVRKWLSRVSTMKKRTPHVLRHTFATTMLNHGAGLESVKKLLGHQSLTTTEIYTHTTFEQLKKIYKSAHPRA